MCGCLSHTPHWGPDLACNPGMCPNWESNQRHFGSQASTQSTTSQWLKANIDADSLLYSLSHFECDGHTVHMLTQYHLPLRLTSTVKSSLFTNSPPSPLSLAARLHQCCANHSQIKNDWTFSGLTLIPLSTYEFSVADGGIQGKICSLDPPLCPIVSEWSCNNI